MSFCNRVVLPVVSVLSLAFLIACGSSSHNPVPPPSGGFSASNLKGTYVFTIVGFDAVDGSSLSMTGTFAANGTGGNGGITGGTMDINDLGIAVGSDTITGGNYSVTSDGRGQANLTLGSTTPWGANSIEVDFVLSTSEHGFITQFDNNGTGSGTLDLQTTASQPAAGTYVLALSGTTGGGNAGTIASAITLDGTGAATGSFDYNTGGQPFLFTLNSGSNITVSGTPGTATLVASGGPTLNFDVYAIDTTHMKFVETDTVANFSGDLFLQTSSTFPSNQVVFTMAGLDLQQSFPLTLGGVMTSDGTSTISSGEEDFNDGGNVDNGGGLPLSFTGTITPPGSGSRYIIQLNNFVNGDNGTALSYTFAAYPYSTSNGTSVALVEIDGNGVSAGVAYSQSSTTLASAQGYGLNLTAQNGNGFEEDDIAEFTTTSTGFSGLIDINDAPPNGGGTSFKQNFNGNYTMDSPATGRGVFTSNFISGALYTVSGTQVIFIETDQSQLGIGAFEQQNASADSSQSASKVFQSDLAARHLVAVKAAAKKAKKQK